MAEIITTSDSKLSPICFIRVSTIATLLTVMIGPHAHTVISQKIDVSPNTGEKINVSTSERPSVNSKYTPILEAKNSMHSNLEKILSFRELQDNWNLYKAPAFSPTLIEKAICTIKSLPQQPKVFPTGRSTVQFEYDYNPDYYLEIEVFDDHYGILEMQNEKELEYVVSDMKDVIEKVRDYA